MSNAERQERAERNDELNLVEYALTVWRRRGQVVTVVVMTLLAALTATFVVPKAYESTSTLLGPKEEGGGSSFLNSLGASAVLSQLPGISIPTSGTNRDILIGVLRSRSVALAVVQQFKLQQRYGMNFVEDAIKELQQNRSTIELTKEGVIVVTIMDTDPAVAAQMANFFIAKTDQIVGSLGISDAGRQRAYIATQLQRARQDLDASEDVLRRFQERNRAIVLPDQTRALIDAAARVKGELMANEVQLQVVRSFATDVNPDVIALRKRIDELRRYLVDLQYGDGVPKNGPKDFVVPFTNVPSVGLDLIRLTRDTKIYETLVLMLTQQLEQAKLAEAKDIPIVRILDTAMVAERQSRPKIFQNVALAGVSGLFVAVFMALFLEYVGKISGALRQP